MKILHVFVLLLWIGWPLSGQNLNSFYYTEKQISTVGVEGNILLIHSVRSLSSSVFKNPLENHSIAGNSPVLFMAIRIPPQIYKTWWFISLLIISILLALFIYIKIREHKLVKENEVLEEKVKERTAEIVQINNELALKNKDITDSILYASRIQNAILAPALPFSDTFVLFLPKDIVSGDFFWFTVDHDKEWLAAVDCTGHGVPGAFMSIIGYNLLDKIVNEMRIVKPSEILNKLNEEVSVTLHQYHQDNQIHDGMDIALICYDRITHSIEYSGAFNPLWIFRKEELIETRANRYSIGISPGFEKDFINHEVVLEPGDTVYLFTDGFPDQFGGPAGKKLKVSYFKELIKSIQGNSMEKQQAELLDFYENWKGENMQVDDILVIGRKFDF